VETCQVLLAVIGPQWLAATDRHGRRRLDDPDDIVRVEVEVALDRDVRVVPLLVGGAAMPQREELPEGLGGLARRHALVVRHDSFRADVGRLITAIEQDVAAGTAAGPSPPVEPPPLPASRPAAVAGVVANPAMVRVPRHPRRRGDRGGVQPRRAPARHRQPRQDGAALGGASVTIDR
jgi:hypothetical protein